MTDTNKQSRPVIRSHTFSQRYFRQDCTRRNFSIEPHVNEELQQKMTKIAISNVDISSSAAACDSSLPKVCKFVADSSVQLPFNVNRKSQHSACQIDNAKPKSTQTSADPAWLDVRNKVQRFETIRAEDRISFKTGTRSKPPKLSMVDSKSMLNLNTMTDPVPPVPNQKPMVNSKPTPNPKPLPKFRPIPNPKPMPRSISNETHIRKTFEENDSKTMANVLDDDGVERTILHRKETFAFRLPPRPALEVTNEEENSKILPKFRPMPNPKPLPKSKPTKVDTQLSGTVEETDFKPVANVSDENAFERTLLRRKETFALRLPPRPAYELANEEESSEDEFSNSDDECVEAVRTWDSWKTLMKILKCKKENEYLFNEMLNAKYEKSIQHIINELITTEEIYVENLLNGIAYYGNICERDDAPIGLRGKKSMLFGNIEQIMAFHRDEFLPMLRRNLRSPKRLFDEFYNFISDDRFYNYVVYTMNQSRSLGLCEVHQDYFKVQCDLNDKLGINSFLLQPIQRPPRYLLLVRDISTLDNRQIHSYGEFFKLYDGHHYTQDDLCMLLKEIQLMFNSSIRLEKKVQKLLTTINESHAINDIVDVNMGKFHKADEFTISSHPLRFSYRAKVFLFDKNIIYTKIKGSQLLYKGCFSCDTVGFFNQSKSFTLFSGTRSSNDPQECRFSGEPLLVQEWCDLITEVQEQNRKKPSHDSGIFGLDE